MLAENPRFKVIVHLAAHDELSQRAYSQLRDILHDLFNKLRECLKLFFVT